MNGYKFFPMLLIICQHWFRITWCYQVTSHYPEQWRWESIKLYSIFRLLWVNNIVLFNLCNISIDLIFLFCVSVVHFCSGISRGTHVLSVLKKSLLTDYFDNQRYWSHFEATGSTEMIYIFKGINTKKFVVTSSCRKAKSNSILRYIFMKQNISMG